MPGYALYEKRKKCFILEKQVKTANFESKWTLRYYKNTDV